MSMTYKKISVIPTNTAIKQAREVQSAADKQAHDNYKEREIQAAMAVNKLTTSIRRKGEKPFRPTTQDVKRIESTPEWKKLHRTIEATGRQMSMAELTSKLSQEGVMRNPDQDRLPPTPASKVSSAKYDANGSVIPQSGQWYFILAQDYYIMWEGNQTYFMSRDDFGTVKHFATRIERGPIGETQIVYASLGRVFDILNSQPSIEDLQKAGYRWERLTLAELQAFGDSDIENAIPLFAKD